MMKRILVLGFIVFALGALPRAVEAATVPNKVPLKLRYPVGTTLYYRLERVNSNYRLDGTKFSSMKAVAYFTRTRLDDDPQGKVQEKFTWKRFEFGQSLTAAPPARLSEFKAAEDFSLVMSVNEEMAIEKFDFSSLPRTFDGFIFMILSWDAVTFDGLVRPTPTLPIPDDAPIGTVYSDQGGPVEFKFSYPPLVSDSRYLFSGKSWVKALGLSRVGDIPCALCESGMLENKVEMNIRLAGMDVKMRGFESFWGKTYVALGDGRVVRGELVGPVTMIQDTTRAGGSAPEHSEFLVIGELTMDLLTENEFKAALAKEPEAPEKK